MVLPFLINLHLDSYFAISSGTTFLLGVALTTLVIGEVINHLRSGLFRVPLPFSYFFYNATGEISKLPKWFRIIIKIDERLPDKFSIFNDAPEGTTLETRFQFDFLDSMNNNFQLDPERALPRDYYDCLLLTLAESKSPRTEKFRELWAFRQNIRIALMISLFFYIWYIGMEFPDATAVILLLAAGLTILLVVVIDQMLSGTPHLFVEMIFKEYYMDQRSE
ncbi:hypothetical protein [Halovivax limisalsi]|uniref:hypothetical protein n=1 Tax=Halovivax limisalsi TaxID=1453760 RepID=UPI001FFD04AC|nr:hypothetical protein [Halovivax limisalsi]